MAEIAHSQQAFAEIESFLNERKYSDAKALSTRLVEQDPSDRQSKLYLLLVNVMTDGSEPHEEEIDQLRDFSGLSGVEKEIIRRIFIAGFKSAKNGGREDQAWIYQRLLRRLLLDQALDQPLSQNVNRSARLDGADDYAPSNDAPLRSHDSVSQRVSVVRLSLQKFGTILHALLVRPVVQLRDAWHHLIALYSQHKISLPRWNPNVFSQRALVGASAGLLVSVPIIYFLSNSRPPAKPRPADSSASRPTLTTADPDPLLKTVALSDDTRDAETAEKKPLQSLLPEQLASLRRAYNNGIQKNPNLMGSLVLKIKMDAGGNVTKVDDVGSRLSDADFVKLVSSEVRTWKFPRSSPGEFTLPLLFVPQDMDPRTIVRWERTVNPGQGEPKLLVPLQITNSTKVEERKTASPTSIPKPAGAKGSKILVAAPSKVEKSERPARHAVDYKTRRVVPLRQEPRFAAAKTEDVGAGTAVSVLETNGDWVKIKTSTSGTVGYVRKEYVAPLNGLK